MELSQNNLFGEELFTVSSNVILPSSEYNYETGTLQPDYYTRRRTQAERMRLSALQAKKEKVAAERAKEQKKKGIRIPLKWAMLLLLMTLIVFSSLLLLMVVKNGKLISEIDQNQKKVNEQKVIVAELLTKLNEETNQGRICYQASQRLHMVPADQTPVMKLCVGEVTTVVQMSDHPNNLFSSTQPKDASVMN